MRRSLVTSRALTHLDPVLRAVGIYDEMEGAESVDLGAEGGEDSNLRSAVL